MKIFKENEVGVLILPYDAWVSTLLAQEAHNWSHDGVAGTLLKIRRKAWVIRRRRIAQKVVDCCLVCRNATARKCQQVLEELYRFLDGLNKAALAETAAKNGRVWMWKVHLADSPHRNGAAEGAVHIAKRALQSLGCL